MREKLQKFDDHQHSQPRNENICLQCTKDLNESRSRVLFVEEEIGRVFCSESCIVDYFAPDIKQLEKEYFGWLRADDLTDKERKRFSQLRWATLKKPDEVWKEKTRAGDSRFTLITQFKRNNKQVWCICICLFLRGEPSFLYLAFPTRNSKMLTNYRRGERIERRIEAFSAKKTPSKNKSVKRTKAKAGAEPAEIIQLDGLGSVWTEEETMMAQLLQNRRKDDIPTKDFHKYKAYVNETLEAPDEVWTLNIRSSVKLIHFMRHYEDESPKVWYVVVARQNEDEEGIEILDAFPTHDPQLVDCYRKGEQQVGASDLQHTARTVH